LIAKMKRLGIDRAEGSASRVRAASVPMSEDPLFRDASAGGTYSRDLQVQETSNRSLTLGGYSPWSMPKEEHISEVIEMTNGIIAGEGGAAEMLGVAAIDSSISHEEAGIK